MSHTSSTVTVRLPEDWMNPTSAVSMWLLEAGVQQQSSKYLSEVVSETILSVSDELRRRRILFVVLEVFETLATTAALQALIVSLAPTVSPPWPQQPEVLQVPLQAVEKALILTVCAVFPEVEAFSVVPRGVCDQSQQTEPFEQVPAQVSFEAELQVQEAFVQPV